MGRIAVDIDSTLYDFCGLACRVMGDLAEDYTHHADDSLSMIKASRLRNAAYATSWAEWRTPIDLAGEEAWNEVVDICHRPENIMEQEPYFGAVVAIENLWMAGHELVFVSNRSPSTYLVTDMWLREHGFMQGDRTTLLCHTEDKLASIRNCQYLIDDRPKTLVGFVHDPMLIPADDGFGPVLHMPGLSGRKAFGLVTPYNRGLTDVPGIYLAPNWPLLGSYLREKIPSAE